MSSRNSIKELRTMAADKDIDEKLLMRQGFAIVADIAEDQRDQKKSQEKFQKEQGEVNKEHSKNIDANSRSIGNYNKAAWFIGGPIVLYFVGAALARLFG